MVKRTSRKGGKTIRQNRPDWKKEEGKWVRTKR